MLVKAISKSASTREKLERSVRNEDGQLDYESPRTTDKHMTQLKMQICPQITEDSRRMTTLMESVVSIQDTRRRHVLTGLVQYILSCLSAKAASIHA